MLFNSYFFLFYFFPIFLLLYLLLRKRIRLANLLIIVFSLLFYASFGIWNLPILVIPLVLDYVVGRAIFKSKKRKTKIVLAFLAISINIILLGYFKYFNFFVNSTSEIFH